MLDTVAVLIILNAAGQTAAPPVTMDQRTTYADCQRAAAEHRPTPDPYVLIARESGYKAAASAHLICQRVGR